ncbi:MAG TPA: acyclic terpene utilization AtuA family protein [Gemmataceae bacterium]|nr:acyclic terpene utilization AtuA family protein [Gemmataceae bacterium]
MKTVRVGNGCGFWGDNLDAPVLLAKRGRLDYLTLEYLAELTMSILARHKQRDPEHAGFATDFLEVLERLCPLLEAQPGLKIITNAGGMNPAACADAARGILERAGLAAQAVATVYGDDLLPRVDELLDAGHALANLDTGESLSAIRPRLVSANAYLGAPPLVTALRQGAAIVITGRVADASLTLAPAVHELGWSWSDWNRLAAGTVAGHLIECGAQVTGGLWCNWQDAPHLEDVGYPIAEIGAGGAFHVTKPPGTGGRVNRETVSEQLLYEVGDPAAYLTPDVIADFTSVTLSQAGPDDVLVEQARGKPATDTYKVSIAYRDGFMASGSLVVFGPEAPAKGRRCGEMMLQRLRRVGVEPEHSNIECLGAGDCVPGVVGPVAEAPEVVLRVSVRDSRRGVVDRFTKEFAPLVTSGPPGVTGYTTGRPQVREVFAYWPALIAKTAVTPEVIVHGV